MLAITANLSVTEDDFHFLIYDGYDSKIQMMAVNLESKQCYFTDKATPENCGDWSQDSFTVAQNGVFVSKM